MPRFVLAVYNVDGEIFVTDDASFSEGILEDDIIECNFHGGQFNVRTREVVLPPCMEPVKTYKVTSERERRKTCLIVINRDAAGGAESLRGYGD